MNGFRADTEYCGLNSVPEGRLTLSTTTRPEKNSFTPISLLNVDVGSTVGRPSDTEKGSLTQTDQLISTAPDISRANADNGITSQDICGVNPGISGFNPGINTANPDINGFNSDVSEHNPNISDTDADVSGANPDIIRVNTNFSKIYPDIKGVKSNISGINPDIIGDNLNISVNPDKSIANPDITAVNADINRVNPNIMGVNLDIIMANPDISRENLNISGINSSIIIAKPDISGSNLDIRKVNQAISTVKTDIIRDDTDIRTANPDIRGVHTDISEDKPDICYWGLHNHGATCYLNTVLQTLFLTPGFREALDRKDNDENEVVSQLREVFTSLRTEEGKTLGLMQALGIPNVREQQDAAEYFERILNSLTPHLSQMFLGRLRNCTECIEGRHDCTEEFSPFLILPLALQPSSDPQRAVSLVECLKAFFDHTVLDGDNQMYCDVCEKKTDTEMWCEIAQCPQVLTLQLKRFEFDYSKMSYVKVCSPVEVPWTLELKEHTYDLYAVAHHEGGFRGGHYFAHIRSSEMQGWYLFNDRHVRKLPPLDIIRSHSAYLLMYMKRDLSNCRPVVLSAESRPHDTLAEPRTPETLVEVWRQKDIVSPIYPDREEEELQDEAMSPAPVDFADGRDIPPISLSHPAASQELGGEYGADSSSSLSPGLVSTALPLSPAARLVPPPDCVPQSGCVATAAQSGATASRRPASLLPTAPITGDSIIGHVRHKTFASRYFPYPNQHKHPIGARVKSSFNKT
ncbi:hypothetical protein GJAV_G00156020 [Gymnothorax javanicus]|nr:hypothetical protein GJAV_G00156020 [Gymnothorax javanicus]